MEPKKVLLIDDDPNVTKLLKAKLEAVGGIAIEVTNVPQKAAALAKSFLPHLIVCDIDMSEWGGEVAQEIGASPVTAKIPVVFLSSMVTPQDMARPTGGRKLISKKIPLTEIINLILKELK